MWPFSSSDPISQAVKNLDPALREFLEREAPKHRPLEPTPASSPEYQKKYYPNNPPQDASAESNPQTPTDNATPLAHPKSLFPDGRYAHLWKTYRDPTTVYRAASEIERLQDLVENYQDRRKRTSKTALENCAFEHWDQNECFRTLPTVHDRVTLCRDYTRRLDRCFVMQARFLRALGYASMADDRDEENERIQMHADRLYREMVAREKAIEAAKARGENVDELLAQPVMSKETVAAAMGVWKPKTSLIREESVQDPLANLRAEKRAKFLKELEGKSPEERALMEREMEAEVRDQKVLGEMAGHILEDERLARKARREAGKETVGDRIKRWWGWKQ